MNPYMAFFVIFALVFGTAILMWLALHRGDRKQRSERAVIDAEPPSPPLDPVVVAIIKSLDSETDRWDLKHGMAFRDDYLAISAGPQTVRVIEDYRGSNDRSNAVQISGAHNVKAIEQAMRLARERCGQGDVVVTYDDIRRKLGV